MALTLSCYPPPTLPTEPLSLSDITVCMTSLENIFSPYLIKTEPPSPEESMDTTPTCGGTYTDLSSVNFSNIKAARTDLYRDTREQPSFSSWTFRHPEHWGEQEVLDWVFFIAEVENFDCAQFRGEAYQGLTGKRLCAMTLQDFQSLDQNYGARLHSIFQSLTSGASFNEPSPPEKFRGETLGNVPHFMLINQSDSPPPVSALERRAATPPLHSKLEVFVDKNLEVKVDLGELGTYDIDVLDNVLEEINDGGYISGSDNSLSHHSPPPPEGVTDDPTFTFSDDEGLELPGADYRRKSHTSSVSSDSGCETNDKPQGGRQAPGPKRRSSSTAKGNHLWEFVRDLLKDSRFNPSLLKWEDRDLGIFKFVQSEAVAQMWGRKKNNPGMTYEKLSRAMRFCRSAGYFESVPKTGRFPKKLCFKFGQKAHDWRE